MKNINFHIGIFKKIRAYYLQSNHIDIASNFGGTLMGITNTFANTCGVIVPAVVGAIVTDEV